MKLLDFIAECAEALLDAEPNKEPNVIVYDGDAYYSVKRLTTSIDSKRITDVVIETGKVLST